MLKRCYYASASILMLALAYHLGASTAGAQAPSNPVVAVDVAQIVYTANGDVYKPDGTGHGWFRGGNVFTGGATSAQTQSFGALKAKYR